MTSSPSSSDLTSLALATSTALFPPTTGFFSNSFPHPSGTFGSASNTSSSSQSNGGDGNSNSFAASSSLYLFTFLATLLLLLAVSCAIVVRSFVIRRRFHRRVQEALDAGVVLPPHTLGGPSVGGRRRDFGEKPRLWDAHLVSDEPKSESRWGSMTPVSVRIQFDKLSGAGRRLPNTPPRPTFLQAASLGLVNGRNWRPRFLRSGPPRPASASSQPSCTSPPTSPSSEPGQPPEPTTEDARLQVSVLIAMPSPYRPRAWASAEEPAYKGKTRSPDNGNDDDDDELPDVAFGVTEVPWKIAVQPESSIPAEQTPSGIV